MLRVIHEQLTVVDLPNLHKSIGIVEDLQSIAGQDEQIGIKLAELYHQLPGVKSMASKLLIEGIELARFEPYSVHSGNVFGFAVINVVDNDLEDIDYLRRRFPNFLEYVNSFQHPARLKVVPGKHLFETEIITSAQGSGNISTDLHYDATRAVQQSLLVNPSFAFAAAKAYSSFTPDRQD